MSTDTEVQESKQENLGPYNGSYRSDVYVEESKNEATLDEQSNESSPYNEETIVDTGGYIPKNNDSISSKPVDLT